MDDSYPPPPYFQRPPPEPPPILPIPEGFLNRLDFFLQNPDQIAIRLREGMDLRVLVGMFFSLSVVNTAIY